MMRVILSPTGAIHGRGTAPYKWVSGLSSDERAHVRNGTALVFIRDYQAHHHTQSGYKVVLWVGGKYIHREPNEAERAAFNRAGGGV